MFRQRVSIAVVATVALVAAATALLGAFGFFSYRTTRNQQQSGLRQDQRILADQLAVGLALPTWNFDREQIDRVIDGAMSDRDVASVVVRLRDRQNSIQARTRDAQWRPQVTVTEPSAEGLFVERRRITAGDAELGTVDVFVTPRFVDAELRGTRLRIIAEVLAFDAVLVLMLGSLLWWLVLRPLKLVELYAAAVRSGERPASGLEGRRFRGELESLRVSIAAMIGLLDGRSAEQTALNVRYARHQAALTVLTRSDVRDANDLLAVMRKITEVVATTLDVARVSIWRVTDSGQTLVCEDVFDQPAGRHAEGARLTAQENPVLFDDAAESDIVALRDPSADPRFTDIARTHFRPLGISSLMYVQIRAQGVRIGALACAHQGPPRTWTLDEQTFVSAVANLISAQMAQIERERAEAQLRQAHKMEAIGQLAGGVAHDFNNILTVILGKASSIAADGRLPSDLQHAATDIVDGGDRAAALTRQLLMFSRRQTVQMREVDLNDAVANLSRMLKRIVGEDVAVDVQYSRQPLYAKADVGMIDQVLLNLAVNARDAMPGGGHIGIRTSAASLDPATVLRRGRGRPGAFVCLEVSDVGAGIRPEHLPHIFEPFFTTKDVGKGTGLGLATTYGIVLQHDGWIDVDSEVGVGTRFRIFLPQIAAASDERHVVPAPPPSVHGSETILVVEDEQDVRMLVCESLAGYGYGVLEAASGPQALEVWTAHDGAIDLVVTDMTMPDGMTGLDLVRQLREVAPALKAIYTSGYFADVSSAEFTRGDHASFYLAKPFSLAELAKTVRQCMDSGGTPSPHHASVDR